MKKNERKKLYYDLFLKDPFITNAELAKISGVKLGTAKSLVGEMAKEGLIESKLLRSGVPRGREVAVRRPSFRTGEL
jgi:Fic family protein